MNKHTPGPWVAHQRPSAPIEYGHHVTTHDGLTVCNVTYQLPVSIDGQVVEATRIANARLIAAAPELLEALKELMVAADRVSAEPVTWLGKARAAIAKAEGAPE